MYFIKQLSEENDGFVAIETVMTLPIYLLFLGIVLWISELATAKSTLIIAEHGTFWLAGNRHSEDLSTEKTWLHSITVEKQQLTVEQTSFIRALLNVLFANSTFTESITFSGEEHSVPSRNADIWRNNLEFGDELCGDGYPVRTIVKESFFTGSDTFPIAIDETDTDFPPVEKVGGKSHGTYMPPNKYGWEFEYENSSPKGGNWVPINGGDWESEDTEFEYVGEPLAYSYYCPDGYLEYGENRGEYPAGFEEGYKMDSVLTNPVTEYKSRIYKYQLDEQTLDGQPQTIEIEGYADYLFKRK